MATTTPPMENGRDRRTGRAVLAALGAALGLVLTLPLVVLAIPLWALRSLASAGASLARRVQPEETSWGELIRFEPEIGWRPRPDMDAHARAGGLFHLTTDAEGWRGSLPLDEAELLAVGDSFAFGQGADDEDLFSEHVPGVRAKPVGANGYNLVQSWLWMERLGRRMEGKTVAWMVYYDNDLLENLLPNQQHYRMPFLRQVDGEEGWEIVTEHVSPEPWPFHRSRHYTDRLAEICSPTRLSRRAFSAAEFLVRRAEETCAGAGANLAVVGIPSPELVDPGERARLATLAPDPEAFDARLPDRRLAEICGEARVPFLALADHLEPGDFLPDDCHWTPAGHRKVGRLLAGLHRETRAGGEREAGASAAGRTAPRAAAGRGG